jgi:hypothetical protein
MDVVELFNRPLERPHQDRNPRGDEIEIRLSTRCRPPLAVMQLRPRATVKTWVS